MRRLALALLVLLSACATGATNGDAEASTKDREPPPPLSKPIPAGTLHQAAAEVEFDDMVEFLAKKDIVYIGESHDQEEHHDIQLRVIEALHRLGRLDGIGMEMFERPQQDALYKYVEGKIGEEEFLEQSAFKERWSDYEHSMPILRFARRNRVPVIALNVSTDVRKKVSEEGMGALPLETRKTLPALYLGDEEHRSRIRAAYDEMRADHRGEFDAFYRVMCLWDDVMTDTIVKWFRRQPAAAQMVVLAGASHIGYRNGIPGRVYRRNGKPYGSLVCLAPEDGGGPEDEVFSRRYADYVWVTEYVKPAKKQ
ncbi:MAG: ChaN family lipoprotein [Planctomycetota bacterium]|nr:ChaN family lipoprotein [Planctomycetota bacterium]